MLNTDTALHCSTKVRAKKKKKVISINLELQSHNIDS